MFRKDFKKISAEKDSAKILAKNLKVKKIKKIFQKNL